jgi:hypothetical protein
MSGALDKDFRVNKCPERFIVRAAIRIEGYRNHIWVVADSDIDPWLGGSEIQ